MSQLAARSLVFFTSAAILVLEIPAQRLPAPYLGVSLEVFTGVIGVILYEWETKDRGRIPHWVYRADGFPLTFAGIWGAWKDPATDEWHRRFSIVTTKAAGVITTIHDRMPVILPDEMWGPWLDRDLQDPEKARRLIRTIDPDLMMEHAVSSKVNSVRNNGPELRLGLRAPGADSLF